MYRKYQLLTQKLFEEEDKENFVLILQYTLLFFALIFAIH